MREHRARRIEEVAARPRAAASMGVIPASRIRRGSYRYRWPVLGRSAGGFTLTEMLVMILIMPVLAVLALMWLGKARAAADNAHCIANLRQLGTAGISYVAEHGRYPASGGTGFGSETKWWFKEMEVELGFEPGTAAAIERTVSIQKCRTCLGLCGHGTHSENRSIRTYSMNHRLLAPTMAETGQMGFPGLLATQVVNPAKTSFFTDGVLVGPQPFWDYLTRPPAWLVPANFIHNECANVVFLDGHIESLRIHEVPANVQHPFWDPKATGGS